MTRDTFFTSIRSLPAGVRLLEIIPRLRAAGGRVVLVGGGVRDGLLGRPVKDLDVEIFGIDGEVVETCLAQYGKVVQVGRAFGVFRIAGLDVDFSLPRRDNKVAPGHRGFEVEVAPGLDFETASRRRDLTINSMGVDLVTGELLDPHGGRRDLAAGLLRATDLESFAEDPLRAVRVAQLSARFEMDIDPALVACCGQLDLSELPGERLQEEFRKLLLKGTAPSRGLAFLRSCGLIAYFPELAALIDVPQDPVWHPEGDVWTHTLMSLDQAAALRERAQGEAEAMMWGVLCHDLGKPATTREMQGRIRSNAHDRAGIEPTRTFLARLRVAADLTDKIVALVEHHLAPRSWFQQGATDKAYRRLARKLDRAGVSMKLLECVARADHLGRTTEDARARRFTAGERFLARADRLEVETRAPRDIVQGRHLIAKGLAPGPEFGRILERCRDLQDETGLREPEQILSRVLDE